MARGNEQEPLGLPQRLTEAGASLTPSGDLPNQITARRYLDRLWSFTETMVGLHLSSTLGRAGLAPEEARGRVSNVFRQVREMWDTTEADEVSEALDRTTFPIPRFELDETVDAGYVYLQDRPVDKTREVTEGVIVDYDAKDEAVGVEILFPALGYTTGVKHHPKSPDASPERLNELAGSIELTGPAPSHKFLEEGEDPEVKP